jgi:hypothetical protein
MTQIENIVIENQSFPLSNWINFLFLKKHIILLSSEGYKKMSFRNRYVVAGSNGVVNLSVPLVNGRNQRVSFNEVKISNSEKWQLTHWRTITSCYNRSPYFEYYKDGLEKFFINRWEFLFEWNLSVLGWLREVLKFPAELIVLDRFPEGAEDLRDRWLPKNFQQDPVIIKYPQIFEDRTGFQNNLSILDMLFNVGPQAADLFMHSSY